jgi:cation diffusion facilitator family transporter
MAKTAQSKKVVYVALAGNVLVTVTKVAAAALTGSSAMLSEAVHSLVDTGNEILLLHGLRRASAPADSTHPFGHGRELYFWSFMVALFVFALGAGVTFYEGVDHVLHPHPFTSPSAAYTVLALSFVFEGTSWWTALKAFRAAKGSLGYFRAMHLSKDPSTFTVLLEDSAALLGLVIAFVGMASSQAFHKPELDGVASIGIALVLVFTAALLARETKGLLIGEPAHPHVRESILRIAGEDPAIANANGVLTVQMGPSQVVAALSAEFEDHLTTPEIEACIGRVETRIRSAHPEVVALFVKPQTAGTWRRGHEKLAAAEDPDA